jgi:hypothetical protein
VIQEMRSRYKEIRGRWREIWLERPMGDKEDPGERHGEIQKDPWEIKMTRGRFRGYGRKSRRSRGTYLICLHLTGLKYKFATSYSPGWIIDLDQK